MRDSYYIGPWRQLPEKVAFEAGLEGSFGVGQTNKARAFLEEKTT